MKPSLKNFLKKMRRSLSGTTYISTNGSPPAELTRTQQMFLYWNAERLNISFEESRNRYFESWASVRGGHAGSDYRKFAALSQHIFRVVFSDAETEVYDAYRFHGPMHFLRMLAYPEPKWKEGDIIVKKLKDRSSVDILDYGCGLAQKSRALASYLKEKGIAISLVLVDIPTIRKDFLLWLGEKTDIPTTFLDCAADTPVPRLPQSDICFAVEFFEHVHDPVYYFNHIDAVLRTNGILVTNVMDHKEEFMHVSPHLDALRERIRTAGYEELAPLTLYEKRVNDRHL
jgi:cyclopropane fatty-acyl-phospholipid synthase-like methyltransferase